MRDVRSGGRRWLVLTGLAAALTSAPPALAAPSVTLDVEGRPTTQIVGANAHDNLGIEVESVGDVNGDGRDDVLALSRAWSGRADRGNLAYVVFGSATRADVDLADGLSRGFRIVLPSAPFPATYSPPQLAGAGDVNGDGLADVMVSFQDFGANGRAQSGSVFVVYGSTSTGDVDLEQLGTRGFRVDGAHEWDQAGVSVAGLGDVDGDGFGDVAIAAPQLERYSGGVTHGALYVVFGSAATPASIDLATPGSRVMRVARNAIVYGAAGPGDVNGDGLSDLAVVTSTQQGAFQTTAFVVLGSNGRADVDLDALGSRGYRLAGAPQVDLIGYLDAAGDLNGDGLGDLVVGGRPGAPVNVGAASLRARVVFGSTATTDVDLGALGSRGFTIYGTPTGGGQGALTAVGEAEGGGDVNGDGLDDIAVEGGMADGGYVVFGARHAEDVNLAELGTRGFRIVAPRAEPSLAAGDVDGDGADDLQVGAAGLAPAGDPLRYEAGIVFVLYGPLEPDDTPVDPATGGTTPGTVTGAPGGGGATTPHVVPVAAGRKVLVRAAGPREVRLVRRPGHPGLWTAVRYTVPAACVPSCHATVEVRRRAGRRLFADVPISGPLLGRHTGMTLRAGQRPRLWVRLNAAALGRARWTTTRAFRATPVRVQLTLTPPAGARHVLVRDGSLKAAIHRP